MTDINFLTLFHDRLDKCTLIEMANEVIDLYGFPCVLRKWNGFQTSLDPLYQDISTLDESNEELFDYKKTNVYIDYNRFDQVLSSWGMSMTENTTLESMMKLADEPAEDDIVEILYPYDGKKYKFKIGSADKHKDICYRVVLNIYYTDHIEDN